MNKLQYLLLSLVSILIGIIIIFSINLAYSSYQNYKKFEKISDKINKIQQLTYFLHEVQKERGLSSIYLADKTNMNYQFLELQRQVTKIKSKKLHSKYFKRLKYARSNVDNPIESKAISNISFKLKLDDLLVLPLESTKYFTDELSSLIISDIKLISSKMDDTKLNNYLHSYNYFLEKKEYLGILRAIISSALSQQYLNKENKNYLLKMLAYSQYSHKHFLNSHSDKWIEYYQSNIDQNIKSDITKIILDAKSDKLEYNPLTWFNLATVHIDKLKTIEQYFLKDIVYISNNMKDKIMNSLILIISGIFMLIIIVILITVKIVKDIVSMVLDLKNKDLQLQQQAKLVSMGEMIENIMHQWRQPLNNINSTIMQIDNIIYQNKIDSTLFDKELLEIENITQYMSQTIDDFRDFYKKDKKKSTFTIEELINNTIKIVGGSIVNNNITLDYTDIIDKKLFTYKNELQQVLLVILNNAKDILISKNIKNRKINISTRCDNNNTIYIEVCDNAGGIEEKLLDRVFEPYFTTKRKTQGTGLGLYIAKTIIEDSMDGFLKVKNNNHGACFTITLLSNTKDGFNEY